jgi:hypothetical protein
VVVELKAFYDSHEGNSIENLMTYNSQAMLELIAANYHSYQLSLVVLTDLSNGAIMLTFRRNERGNNVSIVKYVGVSLGQMATFIHQHLQNNCTPDRGYILNEQTNDSLTSHLGDVEKESELVMRTIKKARVTNLTSTTSWEHFTEMLDDAPRGNILNLHRLTLH